MAPPFSAVPRRIAKADLPTKTCPICGRPFAWRKKWAKDWDAVRYCSERCRRNAAAKVTPAKDRAD